MPAESLNDCFRAPPTPSGEDFPDKRRYHTRIPGKCPAFRICPDAPSVIESKDYAIRIDSRSRYTLLMSPTTRVLFMGTPDYAVPSLEALVERYSIVGVVTQPDRPAGRGRSVRFSPVKTVALEHHLPVFQPKSLRTQQALDQINAWAPDVIVTAAIGHILTAELLLCSQARHRERPRVALASLARRSTHPGGAVGRRYRNRV